jgi:zinc D-Ala-D-Ala carboxypeptidase
MTYRNLSMARRKRKRSVFYLLLTLVIVILSLMFIYIYIIKDRLPSQLDVSESDLIIQADEEMLLEVKDSETEEDVSLEAADKTKTVTVEQEQESNIFNEDISIDWDQDLIVIEDGNELLVPVNKKTTLREDYEPEDLNAIPEYMNPDWNMLLRVPALRMLVALWHAAQFDGVSLNVVSAYRSYSYQEDLFQRYSDSHGPDEANRFSARPGQSEHQLGTTIDFGGTAFDLTAAFAETDQGLWLANNAYLFGFVMSYPEGGEDVTGYIYEPWHYRYIGVEEALNFKRSGLTLTEYLNRKYDWQY